MTERAVPTFPAGAEGGEHGPALALSTAEAARLLGVSETSIRRMAARGELGSIRIGRRVVIPRKALDDFIDAALGPQHAA